MKIAFFVGHFSLRGTEVATYDYARYAEEILGHSAVIIGPRRHPASEPGVEQKFTQRFAVERVDDFSEVDGAIERIGAELLYVMKSGERDGRVSRIVPNAIHAVFPIGIEDIHGERFAFISDWLAQECTGGFFPAVPYVVDLPITEGNMRAELGIPADSVVFARHGGSDSFDIAFARAAVGNVLERRRDAVFLFMNTDRFVEHERAIFLPGTADMQEKVRFIDTADAMLHARARGETFGLACAEFSMRNRPVITFDASPERNHLVVLGEKAITYSNQSELERILLGFDRRRAIAEGGWDRYSDAFSPPVVMRRFSDVFIDPEPLSGPARLVRDWGARSYRLAQALGRRFRTSH